MVISAAVAIVAGASAQTIIQFNGASVGDSFGWSATAAGDVNNDGFPDILIGAPTVDLPDGFAGRCYLYSGPFSGTTIPVSQASATFSAQAFGDNLGVAVAAGGNLNGDSFGDLLMGARGQDLPGIQAGRVYVSHGPLSGTKQVSQANAIFSGQAFDEAGWALAGGFDLNGDHIADVAVGAPFAANVGKAYVFFGPRTGEQSATTANVTITGAISFEDLGTSIAIGDLNHDGNDDLIVGAPHASISIVVPGRVYVFFGPVSGSLLATDADVILEGEVVQDHFGVSVAVGDFNGDGNSDLVVGADQMNGAGNGKGYVFNGPLPEGFISATTASARLLSENFGNVTSSLLGKSVASAGDVNDDGFDDVLIGDPWAQVSGGVRCGVAYLLRGPLSGDIMISHATQNFRGVPLETLGYSLAGAGDINGNGVADFLIGAPSDSFSTTQTGRVLLVLPPRPGDVDNDGDIDLSDLGVVLAAFGTCSGQPGFSAAADFDANGCIDLSDLGVILARFGT